MDNFKIYILFALIIFCELGISKGQDDSNDLDKIIGGSPTTIDNLKYMVSLRFDGYFTCGGALILPRYVVSAAHCVTNSKGEKFAPNRFTVNGGTSFHRLVGELRKVVEINIPSNYNWKNTLTYDVAVLKLESPMTGPNIATIPLCSHPLASGDAVRVSGWGLTKENGQTSDQLRTVIVKIISRAQCEDAYGAAAITPTMCCATSPGKDSCSGDSGGPMVHNGELCGIVSWGIGCARADYPGVYTIVSQVKEFINNQID